MKVGEVLRFHILYMNGGLCVCVTFLCYFVNTGAFQLDVIKDIEHSLGLISIFDYSGNGFFDQVS